MGIPTRGKVNEDRLREMTEKMIKTLAKIYANKSSDEYKMHGDITISSHYSTMERLVNDLSTLKHFPSGEANDIKTMFLTLHRPIWKKMVTEYIAKPDERNTAYTIAFTNGYRLLRGELARIYASTEATEKGIVYKPGKIGRREFVLRYIRYYNENLDKLIEDAIRRVKKMKPTTAVKQEAAVAVAIDNIIDGATAIFNIHSNIMCLRKNQCCITFGMSNTYIHTINKWFSRCLVPNSQQAIASHGKKKRIDAQLLMPAACAAIIRHNIRNNISHALDAKKIVFAHFIHLPQSQTYIVVKVLYRQ